MTALQPEQAWAATYTGFHTRLGRDPELPMWLRLHYLAMERVRRNGHARFSAGELASILGTNVRTGVVRNMSKDLSRKIKTAVTNGVLGEGSSARCLYVPASVLAKARYGDVDEKCSWCDRPKTDQRGNMPLTRGSTAKCLSPGQGKPVPRAGIPSESLSPEQAFEAERGPESLSPEQASAPKTPHVVRGLHSLDEMDQDELDAALAASMAKLVSEFEQEEAC